MFAARTTELATVKPEHSKIETTSQWSDHMVSLSVDSVARLQRMMCNHGMEVIGDTSPALHRVLAVNRGMATPSIQFDFDTKTNHKWTRKIELDPEDQKWEAQFEVKSAAIATPIAGVDTGMKVSVDHAPPELSVFAEMPQYKAIKAAGRLAVRLDDAGVDNAHYLSQFERWWGFPSSFISTRLNKCIYPISVPRLIAAGGKTSSPLYGMENFSGLIRFSGPTVTREDFENENDAACGNVVCVDFATYRAAAKFATVTTLVVPGRGKKAMSNFHGVVGFNINKKARVVVTPASRRLVIPDLLIESKEIGAPMLKETNRAIKAAQNGRLAVIAGLSVDDPELLISKETRSRMGGVVTRPSQLKDRLTAVDIRKNSSELAADFANASSGVLEFCISQLGSPVGHLLKGRHSLGAIFQLVYEGATRDPDKPHGRLTKSKEHCMMLATLWAPPFVMDLQRVCRLNGHSLGDFIDASPEQYPYTARIAHVVLSSRLSSVQSKVRSLFTSFKGGLTLEGHHAKVMTIGLAHNIIVAWAQFYASKAKVCTDPALKIRAQILSRFYQSATLSGDVVDFPDLQEFLMSIGDRYARRKKSPQVDYSGCTSADDVAILLDNTLQPDVTFSMILQSLVRTVKLTVDDLKADNKEQADATWAEDKVNSGFVAAGADEINDVMNLLMSEDASWLNDIEEDDKYLIDNQVGPAKMRSEFYAICMDHGSEADFLTRTMKKPFKTFAEWAKASPDFYQAGFRDLCKLYIDGISNGEAPVAEKDDEDILEV